MAQLSVNTADLDKLIEKANALPNKDSSNYEVWVFELVDGSTVEKAVKVQTVVLT